MEKVIQERVVLMPDVRELPVGEMSAGRIAQGGVTVESSCLLASYRVDFLDLLLNLYTLNKYQQFLKSFHF